MRVGNLSRVLYMVLAKWDMTSSFIFWNPGVLLILCTFMNRSSRFQLVSGNEAQFTAKRKCTQGSRDLGRFIRKWWECERTMTRCVEPKQCSSNRWSLIFSWSSWTRWVRLKGKTWWSDHNLTQDFEGFNFVLTVIAMSCLPGPMWKQKSTFCFYFKLYGTGVGG